MKLSAKLTAEIKQLMQDYWNSYFSGDLDAWASFLSAAYHNIGSTEEEIWNSRKEIVDYTKRMLDQMVGMADFRNKQTDLIAYDPFIMVHELGDLYLRTGDSWTFYAKFRLSSLLKKTKSGWKIYHQHGSFPDARTSDGEAFALDTLQAENRKLNEAVNNRTRELENKNRELQIEVALEKVRAVALRMQQPDDMLSICKIISGQLQELGIADIRNVQTAIIYPGKGSYLNYEYYARHDKQLTTEVDYTNHAMSLAFVKEMQSGPHAFFKKSLEGKQVQDWYQFQKTTNQFADNYLAGAGSLNYYWYSLGAVSLGISTYKLLSTEEEHLCQRFGHVFELAYRRWLDLEKAMAQAREAKIEASLERVRAKAMAMHHSSDLGEALKAYYQQMQVLELTPKRLGVGVVDKQERVTNLTSIYTTNSGEWVEINGPLSLKGHPMLEEVFEHFIQQKEYHPVLKGRDIKEYYEFVNPQIAYPDVPQSERQYGYFFFFPEGAVYAWTEKEMREQDLSIYRRFTSVLSLTYKRYMDLCHAEAQAREAQIEAALERVRSKTMAMHNSQDVGDTVVEMFNELMKLGIETFRCGIGIMHDTEEMEIWTAKPGSVSKTDLITGHIDMQLTPMLRGAHDGWKSKKKEFCYVLEGKDLVSYFEAVNRHAAYPVHYDIDTLPGKIYHHDFYFVEGTLFAFTLKPLTEGDERIFRRFAGVFGQTYRRYLDLQKAEAQAREARIEASLERVRSRAMAMHNSQDLADTIGVFYRELHMYSDAPIRCGVGLFSDGRMGELYTWNTTEQGESLELIGRIRLEGHPVLEGVQANWLTQTEYHPVLRGNQIREYYQLLRPQMAFPDYLHDEVQFGNFFFFREGGVYAWTRTEMNADELQIYRRFATVLSLTYKRFKDLQQAEVNAREAQIEASLERVRSMTMAMHQSSDLLTVINVLCEQLIKLGFNIHSANFNTSYREKDWNLWLFNPGSPMYPDQLHVPYFDHPFFNRTIETLAQGADFSAEIFDKQDKDRFLDHIYALTEAKNASDERKRFTYEMPGFAWSVVYLKNTAVTIANYDAHSYSEEQNAILRRFGNVFEQSYTRFLDLQKAEAQAREAQIETALEKVRGRTLAMQKSEELAETAAVLFQQLILLGIEPNRLYIAIVKDNAGEAEFWITDEDGSKVSTAFTANLNNNPTFSEMFAGWKKEKKSIVLDMQGEELETYLRHLSDLHVPFKGGFEQKRRIQLIAYFSKGFIGMASPEKQPASTLQLLERFAYVFNLTFARFNDLKIAEAHAHQAELDLVEIKAARKKAESALVELKATQRQLIQSEKMASLGELTAGIAHEIQNPLNFVNNFSDVSGELIEEMLTELQKGEKENALEIARDIQQNLGKILFHGKRADSIVKGMLQHSRNSSSQKEPTDINALCDECLRLAYHGLRAKDKSFIANFETDFDAAAGSLNVVAHDIGRVLLNLFNNAFYAVREKATLSGAAFEPKVILGTSKEGQQLIIRVEDNGTGIPENIVDKIFQPFFTTKPTGKGTGLGLSLSYDIVKAHGGDIRVAARRSGDGEIEGGTIFTVALPC